MTLLITSFMISIMAALWVWVMGRKDPAGRPWLTVLCLALLMVIPGFSCLPKWQLEMQATSSTVSDVAAQVSLPWIAWCWSLGVVLMLCRVVRSRQMLNRWLGDSFAVDQEIWRESIASSQQMLGVKRLPKIRIKRGIRSPVVAGLLKPVILMPVESECWASETRSMALLHEMSHLQRRDLWLKLAADLTCAVHWYNPLVWWMRAKLSSQCEYACDARVIAAGADQRAYIHALCDVVESSLDEWRPTGVVAMADHAPLKARVNRLLEGQCSKRPWWAIIAALMTVSTALGLTLVRPDIQEFENEDPSVPPKMNEVELRHSANPFPGN